MRIYFDSEGRNPIDFFPSSIHHSSTVARNENSFCSEGREPIEFFWIPMHHSNRKCSQKQFFFLDKNRVPIEFLSYIITLEGLFKTRGAPTMM